MLFGWIGSIWGIVKTITLIEPDFPHLENYSLYLILIIIVVSGLFNTLIRTLEIRLEYKGILPWDSHYRNLRDLFSDDDDDDDD